MNLESKIISLINTKREGEFWDFKREPHENNASLLHDIICLANSLHQGKRFLIFGVSDPNDGANVIGLTEGQNGRKTQVQFVDFLRRKPFAGDCRPEIELQTIEIESKEIDVLVIIDNPLKPYYLTQDYKNKGKNVRANFIYSRINDTNTPIDKSADIGMIEKMWKQRFGLDLSPLDRMRLLLMQPQNWIKDIWNKSYAYHEQFPEFRIEFSDLSSITESYSYLYANPNTDLGQATFKYHSTTLFELKYLTIDGMLKYIGEPSVRVVNKHKYDICYYYFNLDTMDGIFHSFLNDGNIDTSSRGRKCPFLFFTNKDQQKQFDEYLINNPELITEIEENAVAIHAKELMKTNGSDFHPDPILMYKIKQIYETWYSRNY